MALKLQHVLERAARSPHHPLSKRIRPPPKMVTHTSVVEATPPFSTGRNGRAPEIGKTPACSGSTLSGLLFSAFLEWGLHTRRAVVVSASSSSASQSGIPGAR